MKEETDHLTKFGVRVCLMIFPVDTLNMASGHRASLPEGHQFCDASRADEEDFHEGDLSFSVSRILKPEVRSASQPSPAHTLPPKPPLEMLLPRAMLPPGFQPAAYPRPFILPFSPTPDLDEGQLEAQPWAVLPHSRNCSPVLGGMWPPMLGMCGAVLRPIPLVRPPPSAEDLFLRARVGDAQMTRHMPPGPEGTTPHQRRKKSWSRAVFTGLQRKGLEMSFMQQKYITKPDRKQLASSLGLTDAQVKVWFQNRRMKWRQEQSHPEACVRSSSDDPPGEDETPPEVRDDL